MSSDVLIGLEDSRVSLCVSHLSLEADLDYVRGLRTYDGQPAGGDACQQADTNMCSR